MPTADLATIRSPGAASPTSDHRRRGFLPRRDDRARRDASASRHTAVFHLRRGRDRGVCLPARVDLAGTGRSAQAVRRRAPSRAFVPDPAGGASVKPDNDMIRYLWDGRVQKLGINPYGVVPADPALDFTHTDETRHMPSARLRTPYPPAAQLFFRFVVTLHDSSRVMKLALLAVRSADHPGGVAVADRVGTERMVDARVCVEPAGRPRDRAQRSYRRARRAVDRGVGVLADPGAYRARHGGVRPGGRDQAAADRPGAAAVAADHHSRRLDRARPDGPALPPFRLRYGRVRRGAERGAAHPVQWPGLQILRRCGFTGGGRSPWPSGSAC